MGNRKLKIFTDFIGAFLFIEGILNFISSVIWTFTPDVTDKWFSRFCISIICFGFSALILKSENKTNSNER